MLIWVANETQAASLVKHWASVLDYALSPDPCSIARSSCRARAGQFVTSQATSWRTRQPIARHPSVRSPEPVRRTTGRAAAHALTSVRGPARVVRGSATATLCSPGACCPGWLPLGVAASRGSCVATSRARILVLGPVGFCLSGARLVAQGHPAPRWRAANQRRLHCCPLAGIWRASPRVVPVSSCCDGGVTGLTWRANPANTAQYGKSPHSPDVRLDW